MNTTTAFLIADRRPARESRRLWLASAGLEVLVAPPRNRLTNLRDEMFIGYLRFNLGPESRPESDLV